MILNQHISSENNICRHDGVKPLCKGKTAGWVGLTLPKEVCNINSKHGITVNKSKLQ